MGEHLNSSAKELCKELREIVEEDNWNNLSKFLNDGKTFLKNICKEISEPCIKNDINYNDALTVTVISKNKHKFSEIFKFWYKKINPLPYTQRRTKRAFNNEMKPYGTIDLVNEFDQLICLIYLLCCIVLLVNLLLNRRPLF